MSHELAAFADLASRPAANVGAPAQSILPSSLHPALPAQLTANPAICFALALSLALRLWLAARQHAHVRLSPGRAGGFAGQVSLADHQKAADYTCAKTRLTQLDALWDSAILLGLTLGGGIDALARLWAGWLADPLWQGVAVIASTLLLSSALSLPLSLYATFGVEARFGFNRSTPALYLADLAKSLALSALLGAGAGAGVVAAGGAGRSGLAGGGSVWVGLSLLLMWLFPHGDCPFVQPLSAAGRPGFENPHRRLAGALRLLPPAACS